METTEGHASSVVVSPRRAPRIRRLALLTIAIAAYITAGASAEVRPATVGEQARMLVSVQSWEDVQPADSIELHDARLDQSVGIGAAEIRGIQGGVLTWSAIGWFTMDWDTLPLPDGVTLYVQAMLPNPPTCDHSRMNLIPDYWAESLRVFEAGKCSLGRPEQLSRARFRTLSRARAAANRAIARTNRAINRCSSTSYAGLARCAKRKVRRSYAPAVNRLTGVVDGLEGGLAYASCRDTLWQYQFDVMEHSRSLNEMVRSIGKGDDSAAEDASDELRRQSRIARRTWADIAATCRR